MRIPRLALSLLLLAAVLLGAAGTAGALVDAGAVRASPVAVEEGAPISPAGRAELEQAASRLRSRGNDVRFVVLASRPADPRAYISSLWSEIGRRGDLLVLYPGGLQVASDLGGETARRAYSRALPTLGRDAVTGTVQVAEGLATVRAGGSLGGTGAGTGGGGAFVVLLVLLGLAGLSVLMMGRRARARAQQRQRQDEETERASLEPLVDALAAQVNDLEADMQVGGPRTEAARADADRAVLAYGEARDAMAGARTIYEIRQVGATLEAGLRSARRAQATIDGRSPDEAEQEPLLQGMCTFNPRHGRATTYAEVTTPAGDAAEVPVCNRCAAGLARGEAPDLREVEVNGRLVPYWQVAPQMGGFGVGMNGVFGGALLGLLLGGMMSGGHAFGAGMGDPGGFGGGDFG
ncbi:MAG TPA: hypothetical protein VNT51_12000, partial [Miltoncostaeaceae bacterium]|nr:hypothetical protein [Miltoncostaeaceae bacterium]